MIVIVCLLLISYVLYFYFALVNFVVFYLYFHWEKMFFSIAKIRFFSELANYYFARQLGRLLMMQ